MAEWWSIEVFSSERLPASAWRYAHEDELTEAAITHGAVYYEWNFTQYGVLFEVVFPGDREWDRFRVLAVVRAALDGVPDPVQGLLIYRGRGGAAGRPGPRKPRPAPGAAALELDEPAPRRRLTLPRRIRYDAGEVDRLLREAERMAPPAEPGPAAEPGPPPEPLRVEPDPADPVWRGIAAFDRSDG
jgi:hypothetical protein